MRQNYVFQIGTIVLFILLFCCSCSSNTTNLNEEEHVAENITEKRRAEWLDKLQNNTKVYGGIDVSEYIETPEQLARRTETQEEVLFPISTNLTKNETVPASATTGIKFESGEKLSAQFNFSETPLGDVVAAFASLLGVNYILDPAISNTPVTFAMNAKLSKQELWTVFRQLLQFYGVYISYEEKILQMKPINLLSQGSSISSITSDLELYAFYLSNISVKDVSSQIVPFLSNGNKPIEVEVQNLLLILDTKANIEKIKIILEKLDSPWKQQWSRTVITCHNIPASRMVDELKNIMPILGFTINTDSEKSSANSLQITCIERLQVIIASAASQEALKELGRWVSLLDRDDYGDQERIFVYNIENSKATELVEALSVMFTVDGSAMKTAKDDVNNIDAAAIASMANKATTNGKSNNSSESNTPISVFEEPVRVFADAVHNRLLIRTKPRVYSMIKAMLERVDTIPAQVLLQVLVVEVTLNDSVKFGVEFMTKGGSGNIASEGGVDYKNLAPGSDEQYGGKLWLFNPNNPDEKYGYINALAGKTNVKVISSPQVLVISHDEAEISVGDKVPIVNSEITNTQSIITGDDAASTNLVRNIQYQDTGIILKITPHVTRGGRITIDLDQTVSEAMVNRTSSLDSPQIQERVLKTSMSIQDGQTIICGGIIREKYTDNLDSLPIVTNIPFLRRLVGDTDVSTQRTEMLILVSGTIVTAETKLESLLRHYKQSVESLAEFDQQNDINNKTKRSQRTLDGWFLE